MRFLSIDTSTKYSVVALSDKQGVIEGERRLFQKGRSDALVVFIEEVLKRAGLKKEKIDYLGVGIGPGSFTGLRVGLSTIKGLSYALKKPCLAFSSLDAIAFNNAPYQKQRLCVLVDARRSSVYSRFYKISKTSSKASDHIGRHSKERLSSFESFKKALRDGIAFSGDGIEIYKDELKRRVRSSQWIPEEFWYPTPESICRLAFEGFQSGEKLNCYQVSPLYLYAQDCQVNRSTKKS